MRSQAVQRTEPDRGGAGGGNQEAPAPPEAMAQPFPPSQYPPPPQNGIPAEYATSHTHPQADYTGSSTVAEHSLALYTPTHTQNEQPGNDSNTPILTANTVTQADEVAQTEGSQQLHLQPSDSSEKQQPKRLHVSNIPFRFRDPDLRQMFGRPRSGSPRHGAAVTAAEQSFARRQLTLDAYQPWNGSGASRPYSREITRRF
uniref:RNA binding protein fox-1 n=1 Tax=Larimichthys crocea TaxID=215358 RepID=A0A0F8BUC5_LARCR